MEELANLIDDLEIDDKLNLNIPNLFLLFYFFLEFADPVYLYFLNYGFIEELIEEEVDEFEEDDSEFFLVMVVLMIMVFFFWFFSQLFSLNLIFFLRLFFILGFLFFWFLF